MYPSPFHFDTDPYQNKGSDTLGKINPQAVLIKVDNLDVVINNY